MACQCQEIHIAASMFNDTLDIPSDPAKAEYGKDCVQHGVDNDRRVPDTTVYQTAVGESASRPPSPKTASPRAPPRHIAGATPTRLPNTEFRSLPISGRVCCCLPASPLSFPGALPLSRSQRKRVPAALASIHRPVGRHRTLLPSSTFAIDSVPVFA